MRGVTVAPERIAVKNGFPTTVGDGAVTVELAYQIVGTAVETSWSVGPSPRPPKGVCAASSQDFASDFADGVLPCRLAVSYLPSRCPPPA